MKVTAAVLTYNPVRNDRLELLGETMSSLLEADDLVLADNGSDDDIFDRRPWIDAKWVTHRHPCHTSGFGTNFAARAALRSNPDIVVLSDDDIFWRPGWRAELEAWWTAAPASLILTGCHLEPLFPWNAPEGVVEFGGVRGLLRASTGAATWSFRAVDWPNIGPIQSRIQGWGDVPACQRIRARRFGIAQIDLAEHRGHGRSTWGNTTVDGYGWDLGPVRALLGSVDA